MLSYRKNITENKLKLLLLVHVENSFYAAIKKVRFICMVWKILKK